MNQSQQPVVQIFLDRVSNFKIDRYGLIGAAGYSIGPTSGLNVFSFKDIRKGALKNVKILGDEIGAYNYVLSYGDCSLKAELRIHTSPNTNNAILFLGKALTLHGDIRMLSADQTVILSGGVSEVGHSGFFSASLWSPGNLFFIGQGTTTNGSSYTVAGEHQSIIIGDDCMFANGIHITTNDMHAVVDMATREMLNHPGDVVIEPHVWLGRNTSVGKNVVVGLGSVVGAHALVLHDCPRYSMIGGVPAKVLRSGITWDRHSILRPDTVDRIAALGRAVPLYPTIL